jgi:hypothetical protein
MGILSLPLVVVETQELTVAAASVTFSSISSSMFAAFTGRHLAVIVSAASADAVSERNLEMQLNGDTGSNYNDQNMSGSSSTAAAARNSGASAMTVGVVPGSSVHASASWMNALLSPRPS